MRTGVLSDSSIRRNNPELFTMTAVQHDNLYGRPHIAAPALEMKEGKDRRRRIIRPRFPYMMHHELAKMMNPLNVKQGEEAFTGKLDTALLPKEDKSFLSVVADFDRHNPSYSTKRGMRPETAYLLQESDFDTTSRTFTNLFHVGRNQAPKRMNMPVNEVYEKLQKKFVKKDRLITNKFTSDDIVKLDAAYKKLKEMIDGGVKFENYEDPLDELNVAPVPPNKMMRRRSQSVLAPPPVKDLLANPDTINYAPGSLLLNALPPVPVENEMAMVSVNSVGSMTEYERLNQNYKANSESPSLFYREIY